VYLSSVRASDAAGQPCDDFDSYVSARWAGLVRSVVFLGTTPHDAEDIVQNALVGCFANWDRVSAARSPDAYIYKSILNSLTRNRGHKSRREIPTDSVASTELSGDHADVIVGHATLRSALRALSLDHRTVLVLRFYADLSERETAEVLRVPIGTVKSRAARALERLGERLADPVERGRTL
jgi:RNA polymerase sigma-70 factor (sigma-E family)